MGRTSIYVSTIGKIRSQTLSVCVLQKGCFKTYNDNIAGQSSRTIPHINNVKKSLLFDFPLLEIKGIP